MEKLNKNYAFEKTANQMAAEEGEFEAESLVAEILPLLKEYFIGQFGCDGSKITLEFKNGQNFSLVAEAL